MNITQKNPAAQTAVFFQLWHVLLEHLYRRLENGPKIQLCKLTLLDQIMCCLEAFVYKSFSLYFESILLALS